MTQGKFITFEGTEGSGKSTLSRALAEHLRKEMPNLEVVATREPGGLPLSEKIRAILLHEQMDPWTELFLYEAARAEHLAQVVRPALRRGAWVICDRFTDSTLAYQGLARGLGWDAVKRANRLATQGLTPHLTVHVDIDPALGLSRAREQTRFEAEGVKFQTQVRKGFLKARREQPKRWLKIASDRNSPEQLLNVVLKDLRRRNWLRG